MDQMGEEQLDYGDDEYGGGQKLQYHGTGTIPALVDDEMMGEDDEYDDLYNDVNVGEGFLQTLNRNEAPTSVGGHEFRTSDPGNPQEVKIPGVGVEGRELGVRPGTEPKPSVMMAPKGLEQERRHYPDAISEKNRTLPSGNESQIGNVGFSGGSAALPPKIAGDPGQMPGKFVGASSSMPDLSSTAGRNPPLMPLPQPGIGMNPIMNENPVRPPLINAVENGPTMIYVGELHWWTTDAEIESACSQYGRVKEIKFFEERASGKSKGYCQVEFYDSIGATSCKEGMNGYVFNGKECVVTYVSPQTLKQMTAGYMNKNQNQVQSQAQGRRPVNEGAGRGVGVNFQGGGDMGRNYGNKTGWARGGQPLPGRGQNIGGAVRGRGPIGGKGIIGSGGGMVGGMTAGPYGQGLGGPMLGGPAGGLMHPQGMMGAGFDPTYMGRGAGYGGFAGPAFPGMMPSFPSMNTVGLPGVAPHVNPAFFGRGVSANGMGMMGTGPMDGQNAGMWVTPGMGGWTGDEQERRTRESSYGGDDVASDYGYGESNQERGGRSNVSREKDRGSERERVGNSEKRYRDEREPEKDRSERDRYRDEKDGYRDEKDGYRDEKDGYRDHRSRRDWDYDDDWDRGHTSSRSRSKSRLEHEEDHKSRSRDGDYGKRRRPSH